MKKVNICSSINHDTWTIHKKPSITAEEKGLVGVERSKGWVMLEGLSTPRGQIRPVPEWSETKGKPSLFGRQNSTYGFPVCCYWPYTRKKDEEEKKKEAESKWPRRNPSAALHPSSWLIALSAASSLLIHTHCAAWLICQSEKVALWHFPGSSQLLGQYFSSGGGGGGGDKWPPERWPCRGYWQEETMAESQPPPPLPRNLGFCPAFFVFSH